MRTRAKQTYTTPSVPLFVPYTLCTTEEQFLEEMRALGVTPGAHSTWSSGPGSGCCHLLSKDTGEKRILVCIRANPESSGISTAALIVHEAVHVWQMQMDDICEKHPSDEFMAYGIQYITQTLLEEYSRQTKGKGRKRRGQN
jgi:hypothetical protein